MQTEKHAYYVTLSAGPNARIQRALSTYGNAVDESATRFLCWLTDEDKDALSNRYDSLRIDKQALGYGGERPGAGRPTTYTEPMQQISIRIPERLIKLAVAIGDGNRSAGIVKALELYRATASNQQQSA